MEEVLDYVKSSMQAQHDLTELRNSEKRADDFIEINQNFEMFDFRLESAHRFAFYYSKAVPSCCRKLKFKQT